MHVPFLCVQFRNLLPSEELLRHARSLWTEHQERSRCQSGGHDAMLSVARVSGNPAGFDVELSLPGVLRTTASDCDALTAIERVFTELACSSWASGALVPAPVAGALVPAVVGVQVPVSIAGKSATLDAAASLPDTTSDAG